MGLLDFARKQFIDVIEWVEEPGDSELCRMADLADREIQTGAALVVRPGQAAVFVDGGKIADVFGPGTVRLETKVLPLLTNLRHWDKLFEAPFKSDVVFVSTKERIGRGWGTAQPLIVKDESLGTVRVRAHGTWGWRVSDAGAFLSSLGWSDPSGAAGELERQVEGFMLQSLGAALSGIGVEEASGRLSEVSEAMRENLAKTAVGLGVEVRRVAVESVSLPDSLTRALDGAARVRMFGGMEGLAAFEAADSLKDAASNPGGLAALGAGAAAGAALAQSMAMGVRPAPAAAGSADDPYAKLRQLKALLDDGVISQSDYDAQKARLLGGL